MRKLLADESTSAEEREKLYSDLKEWRTRVSALNDLGHELMHSCDITASSILDNELKNINKNWTEVTTEVSAIIMRCRIVCMQVGRSALTYVGKMFSCLFVSKHDCVDDL